MTVFLILLAALAVASIAGSLRLVASDGYARLPTRRTHPAPHPHPGPHPARDLTLPALKRPDLTQDVPSRAF
jgi:hypothetical protein